MKNADLFEEKMIRNEKCQSCLDCQFKFVSFPQQKLMKDYLRDGYCELACANGHTSKTCILNFKFELQFQIGFLALLDDHYTEAVCVFAKAVERFHEFCSKVFLLNDLLPNGYDHAWNEVKKQPDRQLGAFIFLYLKEFGEAPIFKNLFSENANSDIKDRIVLEGYLPSANEARDYAENVYEYISSTAIKLSKSINEKICRARYLHCRSIKESCPSCDYIFTNTLISFTQSDIAVPSTWKLPK